MASDRIGFRMAGQERAKLDKFQRLKQALGRAVAEAEGEGFVAVVGLMQPGRLGVSGKHTGGRWYAQCSGDHMGLTGLVQLIGTDVDSEMERNLEREHAETEEEEAVCEGDGESGAIVRTCDGEYDDESRAGEQRGVVSGEDRISNHGSYLPDAEGAGRRGAGSGLGRSYSHCC